MRKPRPDEFIICPNSQRKRKKQPEKCFDSTLNKKPIAYGVIGSHKHGYGASECEYTGHVVPIENN